MRKGTLIFNITEDFRVLLSDSSGFRAACYGLAEGRYCLPRKGGDSLGETIHGALSGDQRPNEQGGPNEPEPPH